MENVLNCLIIGSGPAGYTAAIYAARAGMSPVMVEGLERGGQLTTTTEVENFPGYPDGIFGTELMENMRKQAERFGTKIISNIVTGSDFSVHPLKVTLSDGNELCAHTIIIATGATAKYLGLEDEKKYRGSGVSACATCDGFFYRNKNVAVVGGGDTACEEALYLSNLASKVYLIEGSVIVNDGATLTIPAGTTIRAKEGFANYLLVAQGGKIMAEGTAENPITFTAENEADAKAGYWGGVIINGKAPISGDNAGTLGSTEINNDFKYGGTNSADNSGVLKYVRILYTGANSSDEIEHNGLTLNGVGNGTVIENIYVADGADDAIEFFGGSVNVTGLLAVNCDDDMFDFTQGYCGTLKDCYGRWEAEFVSTEEDPRGVEADGNLDGNYPGHTPQSDFAIENMTIENLSATQEMQDAIKVRRGAEASITNALVKGSGLITNLVDLTDGRGMADNASDINVTNEATDVTTETNKGTCTATVTVAPGNTGCTLDFAWTGYNL